MADPSNQTTISESSPEELAELYDRAYRDWQIVSVAAVGREHASANEVVAEIERLRGVIVGCEIALNRDDDVSAVRRMLVKERHANGY